MTELLTYEQVAERLGVSARQVHRYVSEGRLRVVRLSYRVVRVKASEVEAFIAHCERKRRAA